MQRRRRQWVSSENLNGVQLPSASSPAYLNFDLLANMPGSQEHQAGLTIAHIFGWVQAISSAESTPSSTSGHVNLGITFVPQQNQVLAAGSTAIPNPTTVTEQDTAWYWRWKTPALFSDVNNQPASLDWPYIPVDQATVPINIRSQRKVGAGNILALIASQEGWTSTHEPVVAYWLRILVLLP